METFTQKWAIVSLLEEAEEGSEFYYTDFPLHVTLAGIFATNKSGHELADKMVEILLNQHPVKIEAYKKDMFGPNKDVAVMKIKKSPELMALYNSIFEWLERSGVKYNSPEYQGDGYLPHSTFQKSGSLKEGERRILHSVSLIDLYPNNDGYMRKISKIIELA